MTERESLLDKLIPFARQLEYLTVMPADPGDYSTEDIGKHLNDYVVDVLNEKRCDIVAHHRAFVGHNPVYRIEAKVRIRLRVNKSVDRGEVQEKFGDIESLVFSPISLLTAIVTDQMGQIPLVFPPFRTEEPNEGEAAAGSAD